MIKVWERIEKYFNDRKIRRIFPLLDRIIDFLYRKVAFSIYAPARRQYKYTGYGIRYIQYMYHNYSLKMKYTQVLSNTGTYMIYVYKLIYCSPLICIVLDRLRNYQAQLGAL